MRQVSLPNQVFAHALDWAGDETTAGWGAWSCHVRGEEMATGQKARPVKERFDAAVAVIRSLPKEGTPPGT